MHSIETAVDSGMRLTCSRDELAQALGIVSRGVSTRGSVQILGGILLRAETGSLQVAATDMEISLRTSLDVEVGEDGAVVVPGRLLVDIVRMLPQTEVELEHRLEEHTLRIPGGAPEYRLRTYGAEDFRRLPDVDCAGLNHVEAEPLLETIARV